MPGRHRRHETTRTRIADAVATVRGVAVTVAHVAVDLFLTPARPKTVGARVDFPEPHLPDDEAAAR